MPNLLDTPPLFVIFGLTLLGVAIFHRRALVVALTGLLTACFYVLFSFPAGMAGGASELAAHFGHESVILSNLLLLLLGFAVLSNQFEKSGLPEASLSRLPDGWSGTFALVASVFVLSIFLDNIAGAIIGGVIARHAYKIVSVGLLVAIVAAANAGGAGSVIGDTTTTMMWVSGISPLEVAPAFIGALAALAIFGAVGAVQQQRHAQIKRPEHAAPVDWVRALVVLLLLAAILITNLTVNGFFPQVEERVPALGLGLWAAIVATAAIRKPDWSVARGAAGGAVFLIALVALASLMPVEELPPASVASTFGLGLLSAVFDNIPLTALALNQGGYDWGLLAYAVGFGGSMLWFGSSAGVALSNLYPETRSVVTWLRHGWHIPIAYGAGFAAMLAARML